MSEDAFGLVEAIAVLVDEPPQVVELLGHERPTFGVERHRHVTVDLGWVHPFDHEARQGTQVHPVDRDFRPLLRSLSLTHQENGAHRRHHDQCRERDSSLRLRDTHEIPHTIRSPIVRQFRQAGKAGRGPQGARQPRSWKHSPTIWTGEVEYRVSSRARLVLEVFNLFEQASKYVPRKTRATSTGESRRGGGSVNEKSRSRGAPRRTGR